MEFMIINNMKNYKKMYMDLIDEYNPPNVLSFLKILLEERELAENKAIYSACIMYLFLQMYRLKEQKGENIPFDYEMVFDQQIRKVFRYL